MWRVFWTFLVELVLLGDVFAQRESRIVQLEQGPVLGYKDPDGGVYSFLNIPYATAPKGINKYKAPLPPPVWTDPYDESNRTIACLQPRSNSNVPDLEVVEDCLIANVYIPDTATNNLPVLVFVHGGAYLNSFGQSNPLNDFVKSQNIIAVSFNYRLGVQGFLCLGTEDVPGNAGMKDQVALLRWVQKNIASFGGNPDQVTIQGCSAGGGSVDFLTLSPMAKGLFSKAIVESGAAFGYVGAQIDPIENAKKYAKLFNFTDGDDIHALEEFYKTASNELLMSEPNYIINTQDSTILFAPCVERNTGEQIFLDSAPLSYLMNSSSVGIPLIVGFSEMEGLYKIPEFDDYKSKMNENFSDFLPADLQFESKQQKEEVAAQVKHFYFGNQNVSEETILAYVNYFSDVMYLYPAMRTANMRASMGDTVYVYEYSFVDESIPFVPHTNIRGANHCSQKNHILFDLPQGSEEFQTIQQQIRQYWRNFIVSGNPTPEGATSLPPWSPLIGISSPYMSLSSTIKLETSPLNAERIRLWDSIYEQYNRLPIPPVSSPASNALVLPAAMLMSLVVVFLF